MRCTDDNEEIRLRVVVMARRMSGCSVLVCWKDDFDPIITVWLVVSCRDSSVVGSGCYFSHTQSSYFDGCSCGSSSTSVVSAAAAPHCSLRCTAAVDDDGDDMDAR